MQSVTSPIPSVLRSLAPPCDSDLNKLGTLEILVTTVKALWGGLYGRPIWAARLRSLGGTPTKVEHCCSSNSRTNYLSIYFDCLDSRPGREYIIWSLPRLDWNKQIYTLCRQLSTQRDVVGFRTYIMVDLLPITIYTFIKPSSSEEVYLIQAVMIREGNVGFLKTIPLL